jgi:hypothetical protein
MSEEVLAHYSPARKPGHTFRPCRYVRSSSRSPMIGFAIATCSLLSLSLQLLRPDERSRAVGGSVWDVLGHRRAIDAATEQTCDQPRSVRRRPS